MAATPESGTRWWPKAWQGRSFRADPARPKASPMSWTMAEIAAALGQPCLGDALLTIARAAEPQAAGPDDLAIALSPAWGARLAQGRARAALIWPGADWRALGLRAAVEAPRGRLALARLTGVLDPGPGLTPGLSAQALIEPGAELGADVWVGAFSVIGAGARIGPGTRIGAHVTIAPGAEIGAGGLILAGVRIGPRVRIGARVVVQPNAVIGADGFSFVTETPAALETARASLGQVAHGPATDATWHRIHSLGGVEIGDDVEIGANSTIDAGTIRATRVGRGSKIDNLVQVGHNVTIGQDCLLCAQAGIAGSARIGDRVVLGGKAGVGDNLQLGDDVVLGGGTIVLANVPPGAVMLGYPAMPMPRQIAAYKALRRLPRLLARLAGGEKPISKAPASD